MTDASTSSHPAPAFGWWANYMLPALAALAAAVANWPILGNYFFTDDFEHFFDFANFGFLYCVALPHAGHMYLVRNTVFYLLFQLFGMHPIGYYVVAMLVHVLNVLLLFALVRRLTGSARLACVGALLFGVSPTNSGTLGWVSVHGHALAAMLTLIALLLLVPREGDASPPSTRVAAGAAVCMLAASQCFGTAIAIALMLPVLAAALRPSILRRPTSAALLCVVPVLTVIAMWIIYPHQSAVNSNPILASGLPVWMKVAVDVRHVAPMMGHILALGAVGLVLGAAYPLTRYPDAIAIGIASVLAGGVAGTLIAGSWRDRRVLVALLALVVGCYVAVAAGRATLYADLASGHLIQVYVGAPRFHYLAQAGIAVVVCTILAQVGRHVSWRPGTMSLLFYTWVVWVMATGILLRPPIDHYESVRASVTSVLERIAGEVEKHPVGSTVCVPNSPVFLTIGFPGAAGVFMLHHRENELDGRRVFFVTSEPSILKLRLVGGRFPSLVLPPGECPPGEARGPA